MSNPLDQLNQDFVVQETLLITWYENEFKKRFRVVEGVLLRLNPEQSLITVFDYEWHVQAFEFTLYAERCILCMTQEGEMLHLTLSQFVEVFTPIGDKCFDSIQLDYFKRMDKKRINRKEIVPLWFSWGKNYSNPNDSD